MTEPIDDPQPRRPKGEGTLYLDEKTGVWIGQVDLGRGASGTRTRRKVTGRTKTEAARKMAAVRKAHADGVDTSRRAPTVEQLADEWLDKAAARTKAASTMARVSRRVRQHLVPALGRMRLDRLRPEDVETWLASEAEAGAALRTVQDYRQDLRQMLGWAQRRRLVSWNVAAVAELPTSARPTREKRSFTPEEAERLLEVLETDRHGPYFTVLLLVGLRPGEADALTWDAIDLEARTMLVDRALQRGDDGRPLGVGPTKTKQTRTVRISEPVVSALRRQRVQQAADRLAAGPGYSRTWADHVFLNELGRPFNPSNVRRNFGWLCAAAEVPSLTPYELRHSTASLLAAAGVAPFDVADLLGHADLRMLERFYRHRLSPVASGAAEITALLPGRKG